MQRGTLKILLAASDYGLALGLVILASLVCFAMAPSVAASNLVMVYLLEVTLVATRASRGAAAFASVLSVAAFDFFFVPPRLTFAVADSQHLLTFGVMLLVALLISTLASRARIQADALRQRERRTAALYEMSRELSAAESAEEVGRISGRHVREAMGVSAFVLVPGLNGALRELGGPSPSVPIEPVDEAAARWVLEHRERTGLGTDRFPGSSAHFLPLAGSDTSLGVFGVRPSARLAMTPEQIQLTEAFAGLTATTLDRARLQESARAAQVEVETERLRNSLLSSVSHDLRTPLASITGAASSLLDVAGNLKPSDRSDLLETIHEEAFRLNRLVANLLDMTRLESGALQVRKEWLPIEEPIGGALDRLETALKGRFVETKVDEDLPLAAFDGLLIELVLVNLIENALKYTPPGTPITVAGTAVGTELIVEVADRGPGVPAGQEERIFDKFHRLGSGGRVAGVGLGLAICRGIVTAHGGRIHVENRDGGGATFRFSIPIDGRPPAMPDTESVIR